MNHNGFSGFLSELAKRQAVWRKTYFSSATDDAMGIRKDIFGNRIMFSHYGNRYSDFGWEYDHIIPLSRGGYDVISNIQPLHWRSNIAKSNSLLGGLAGLWQNKQY